MFKVYGLAVSIVLGGLFAWGEHLPWAEDLHLALDGTWRQRAIVEVTNDTAEAWSARPVGISADILGVAGARLAELRLTDEQGAAFRVGVLAGNRFVDTGVVPVRAQIVFPVRIAAHARRRYVLYWDNPRSWEIAEKWRTPPHCGADVCRLIARETLDARHLGVNSPWPKDAQGFGTFRVPIVVANLSNEDRGRVLASFLLADALHGDDGAELVLTFDGKRVSGARFGTRYLFPVELPARTIRTYYLYARTRKIDFVDSAMAGNGIVSEILSDQASIEGVKLSPREERDLLALAADPANVVRNPALEGDCGVANWDAFAPPSGGVTRRVADSGGVVGPRCVEQTIADSAKPAWRFFGPCVKVRPGRPYLCGALVRTQNLSDGAAALYFNEFDAAGKVIRSGGGKSANSLSGTTPWTDLWRIFETQPQTASIEMNLSSKSRGTSAMDCAIVAEHAAAGVGEREYPPNAHTPTLAICRKSNVEKVFPERPIADEKGPWRLKLARNETENLQLAVRGGEAVAPLVAEVTGFAETKDLTIETHVVELVPSDTPIAYERAPMVKDALFYPRFGVPRCDGWHGLWPDPLVKTNALDLAAETTRAFQFAVKAGPHARAGIHRGKIRWMSARGVLREEAFEIEVWDFSLPERPDFCAGYDIRFEPNGFFLVPGEKDHVGAVERLTALMAEYKVAPTAYYADDSFFTRDASGRIVADFTRHDAAARRFFEHYRFPDAYIPRTPFYGFGVAATPQTFLGEKPYEEGESDRAKLRPAYVRAFQEALRIYWDHMKEKGWDKKVVLYISDEPRHWTKPIETQMIALCKMIHEVDPKLPIYSSTWQFRPSWLGSIDVWGGGAYGCFTEADREAVRKAGGRLWFTTDGQMCIDTPYCAIEQMLPLYAACHGVEKYEFWGISWVTHNPWRFGWHAYVEGGVRFPNGDGFLVYPPRNPAADPTPCASVRLVAARDGVELHTYYKLLERLASVGNAQAGKLLEECRRLCVIPNAGGRRSTRLLRGDANVLERWRERAGDLIAK